MLTVVEQKRLDKLFITNIILCIVMVILTVMLITAIVTSFNLKQDLTTVKDDLSDTLSENYYLNADVARLERIVSDVFNTDFTKETTVYHKIVTATAYTAREEECNDEPEITASGRPSRIGGIAVSRDLEALGINIGDLVVIKNMGLFKVEDRTAEMKRKNTSNPVPVVNTIDILHANVKAAKIFGTGTIEIIWLGERS